ncbi:MAG: RNA polymerase sigma-70 factor [Candidatus Kryptonium sp.]
MKEVENLIQRIKEGDESAFEEFFLIFYGDILRFIYLYIGDEDTSKDLAQETFINFWMARDRIDISLNPKSYLLKIAKNLAINYVKRERKQERIEEIEILPSSLVQEPKFESFELREAILKAINELPGRCREVFILARYSDLDYKEIAEILGISVQTVKNHIVRAINYLREKLKDYLE